jgi:hypothetical protein
MKADRAARQAVHWIFRTYHSRLCSGSQSGQPFPVYHTYSESLACFWTAADREITWLSKKFLAARSAWDMP